MIEMMIHRQVAGAGGFLPLHAYVFLFCHVSVPFTFFFLPTGEVLVPAHLIHLGGHNNRHINPRFADHPHKGQIISGSLLAGVQDLLISD